MKDDFINNNNNIHNNSILSTINNFNIEQLDLPYLERMNYLMEAFIPTTSAFIDEYVKPAVAADGGNIVFESFNPETRVVKVIMQGACNGCPSSTFTLKNGIETMLRNMLTDDGLVVEAY